MPRLKESTRDARRHEIALAALRVLQREGLAQTSIADIVAELGGSTGGIYASFADKSELARYIATAVLGWRTEILSRLAAQDPAPTPGRIVQAMLAGLQDEVPLAVSLQFWGQATTDEAMRDAVQANTAGFRTVLAEVVAPWIALQRHHADSDEIVQGIMSLAQGYIVQCAMNGPTDPATYLAQVGAVLGTVPIDS